MHDALPLFPVLLPAVPFDERQSLPRASGIYFALTPNGDVLYVGATKNLRQRWNAHSHIAKLQTLGCATIAFYTCEIGDLAATEQAMISQFQPPLNSSGEYAYKPSWLSRSGGLIIAVSMRLPKPIHAKLTALAQEEGRSLHSLIIWILKQALTAHKKGDA